ncbi:hypothetical protein PS2_031817 [Malus domestica]
MVRDAYDDTISIFPSTDRWLSTSTIPTKLLTSRFLWAPPSPSSSLLSSSSPGISQDAPEEGNWSCEDEILVMIVSKGKMTSGKAETCRKRTSLSKATASPK